MDKQIIEMAEVMAKNWYNETMISTAERLYNAGYRKIDEGSMVLSKSEYNWLVQSDKEDIVKENKELGEQCLEWMELYHKQITKTEQARKQAVKEFAERLKKERQLIDLGCGDGCYEYIDIDDIDYIAIDEFGVEL